MALRIPNMDEFNSISLTQIGVRVMNNLDSTILWCREYGLLAVSMDCNICGVPCTQQNYVRAVDKVVWRCKNL